MNDVSYRVSSRPRAQAVPARVLCRLAAALGINTFLRADEHWSARGLLMRGQ